MAGFTLLDAMRSRGLDQPVLIFSSSAALVHAHEARQRSAALLTDSYEALEEFLRQRFVRRTTPT